MASISKIANERNHRTLIELAMKPGNDICADCKARAPRWASYSLGIFICVHCASIHRKIGTHISKVKSITLDAWSKEQVEVMKEIGNVKSNAHYNPNESLHPPPTNMVDRERDSELEKFIRAKYEFKRFVVRPPASQPVVPPPRTMSGSLSARPQSIPITESLPTERKTSPTPPPPPAKTLENMPGKLYAPSVSKSQNSILPRSVSQPLPSNTGSRSQPISKPSGSQVWDDLISLDGSPQSSSLPLQYQSHSPSIPTASLPLPSQTSVAQSLPALSISPNPYTSISLSQGLASQMPPVNSPMAVSPGGNPFKRNMTTLGTPSVGSSNPFNQQFPGFSSVPSAPVTTGGFPTAVNLFPSMVGESGTTMGTSQSFMPHGLGMMFPPQPQHQQPQLQYSAQPPLSAAPQAPFSTIPQSPFSSAVQQPFLTGTSFLQRSQQLQSDAQSQQLQQQHFGVYLSLSRWTIT
ncbi:hypothetical protein F5I97DRAFT_145767 [Phlebopus sp. FC_14]|nr:hypothetical protein F5I97DRAFT_145767 [Phlebopus sp. FC_14]